MDVYLCACIMDRYNIYIYTLLDDAQTLVPGTCSSKALFLCFGEYFCVYR